MKKRTCKILLGIGILLSILMYISSILFSPIRGLYVQPLWVGLCYMISIILLTIGVALIIITIAFWNSEKKGKRKRSKIRKLDYS